MELIKVILPYGQLIFAVLLISLILLQRSEAGLGSAFGDSGSSMSYTRRGPEKVFFRLTIVTAILFTVSSLVVWYLA